MTFLHSIIPPIIMSEQTNIIEKIRAGLELFRRRDFINAEAEFRQVVEARPDSFYGWFHLGRTLFYRGNVEASKQSFQQALRINLELANNWLNEGKFCAESTGHQTDESCLAEYLYEHERDGEIRKILAEVFYENRSIVTRDHCFDEKAISDVGGSGEDEKKKVLIKRRNCHVTTH